MKGEGNQTNLSDRRKRDQKGTLNQHRGSGGYLESKKRGNSVPWGVRKKNVSLKKKINKKGDEGRSRV